MPLHARAFGDGGDARMRRPPLRVQIDSRLDDAAAGFRLIFRPLSKRIAALSIIARYCTPILTPGHNFITHNCALINRPQDLFRQIAEIKHESIVSEFPCRRLDGVQA